MATSLVVASVFSLLLAYHAAFAPGLNLQIFW